MLHHIKFKKKYRCFEKGYEIHFRPGINFLVGEQGCGKSSVLALLNDYGKMDHAKETIDILCDKIKTRYFDFEHNNPRTLSYFDHNIGVAAQMGLKWASHGQANNAILAPLEDPKLSGMLFMFDEPDMALSIRSCYSLVKMFKGAEQNKCQILAAVHSPILIASVPEVLSFEHKRWMPSQEFIADHSAEKKKKPSKRKKGGK